MGQGKKIIEGRPGAMGVAVGVVRVVDKDKAKMELLMKGEIMVAERTTPDDEMYMARAEALVTDVGGSTSHTAIIAREMGKPLAPRSVRFVSDIPKTRNAKVMRRVIRSAALGEPAGDLSALVNPGAVEEIERAA